MRSGGHQGRRKKTKGLIIYSISVDSIPADTAPTRTRAHDRITGIILSADKDDVLVEYATGGISNKIFVSKYQLYLPDKKLLQKQVKAIMESE